MPICLIITSTLSFTSRNLYRSLNGILIIKKKSAHEKYESITYIISCSIKKEVSIATIAIVFSVLGKLYIGHAMVWAILSKIKYWDGFKLFFYPISALFENKSSR